MQGFPSAFLMVADLVGWSLHHQAERGEEEGLHRKEQYFGLGHIKECID